MTIFYSLFENHLTSDPDDYVARVTSQDTVDQDTLIDDVIKRGTTVTRPDLLAALDAYNEALVFRLLEGQRVNTPVANFGMVIRGTFDGADDEFDPSRHLLLPTVSPGALARRRIQEQGRAAKSEAQVPEPNPVQYRDFGSEMTNSVLTPGSPGGLTGHRLKFDAADEQQGVFFVAGDGSATKAGMVMRNKPAELMFMVPDGLAVGGYTLEVRAVVRDKGELRTGRLRHPLVVVGVVPG